MLQIRFVLKIFAVFLILWTIGVLAFLYIFRKNTALASPVLGVSNIRIADNIWLPEEGEYNFRDAPEVTAKAAYFIETRSGKVLYEKNSKLRVPIASLSKIMTVIIALENRNLSSKFSVSERAAGFEPDKMFLIAGETLTLEELLSGIFLISANDAAEVLAEGITGSREEFIGLMNSKAKQLGMNNTLFINPSGLEEDAPEGGLRMHYSTAYDTALMSRYLIRQWPHVLRLSSQERIFLPKTVDHQDYDMYNGINLITTYPGVIGLKTGFTPEAGLTLVTVAQRDGHEVLGVLLGATNRRDDAKGLLDYAFKKLGVKI